MMDSRYNLDYFLMSIAEMIYDIEQNNQIEQEKEHYQLLVFLQRLGDLCGLGISDRYQSYKTECEKIWNELEDKDDYY